MDIEITQPELVRVAAMFQSTDETRYYLNGVYFCKAEKYGGVYIVSTDGHRMSVGYDAKGKIDKPAIIRFPVDFLKRLTPKKEPIVLKMGAGPLATIAVNEGRSDKDSVAVCSITVIDGIYPEWRRVVPTFSGLKGGHGAFNAKYLAEYRPVLSALGVGPSSPIKIIGEDSASPHRVHIGGVDNWFGVLMPMRFEGTANIPVWFAEKASKKPT